MHFNYLVILSTALIPLLVGFVWYNPKTFGGAWQRASGVTQQTMEGANMGKIFGLTFLCGLLLAFVLPLLVIHQTGVHSALMPTVDTAGSENFAYFASFMEKYGENFRTFKHGALHGFMSGLFIATPVLGVNALFERKSFTYVAINAGYWIVSMALMGGVICQWA